MRNENTHIVGVVKALYRYPVKSMRGECIDETRVWWHGFEGDRRYAFVRGGNTSRFPWLTARDVPAMLRYAAYFSDPAQPVDSPVRVRTPEGDDLPVESDALALALANSYGGPVHLMQSGRGTFDSMGVSLISTATLEALGTRAGLALDPLRFRPNILVETAGGEPFAEEAWVGRLLTFGAGDDAARIRANRKDRRCMMVNLDPETARQDPA
ncbi:MAG TPA: MOSC N-terminal beta barrel domain-containing protein, partial [Herpetosiphonaceae bacterium]|nr:MOSC N-terminal beta barrel domain-containing protein [Herpetosiphonaceae bacterium]